MQEIQQLIFTWEDSTNNNMIVTWSTVVVKLSLGYILTRTLPSTPILVIK